MDRTEQIRECNNPERNWIGWESDCVHPKHAESLRLSPECHETTEQVTPTDMREIKTPLRDIKAWDIRNLVLDIPHDLRKRIQEFIGG